MLAKCVNSNAAFVEIYELVLANADWKVVLATYVPVRDALDANDVQPALVYPSNAPKVELYLKCPGEL